MRRIFTRLGLPLLLLLILLSACAREGSDPMPSAAPVLAEEPTPTPEYAGPRNPLTGLPIPEEWANRRPIAVMLNNLKAALPQMGVSKADIIYEVLAEGGITRMLAVYQSMEDVGQIGTVRSSRPYYLELALGLDAIYLHAGGSEDAYAKIKAWGVTALDCVRGSYEGREPGSNLFWRDADRRKNNGYEHSVVTSGDVIIEKFTAYGFRQEHADGYTYDMTFLEDGTPGHGERAQVITVPFSTYKTGVFTYDRESGCYLVEEYDKPYVDGNTGEQVGVTNVVVIRTSCTVIPGDTEGRLNVDLISGGDGWYACGGKIIPIRWSKADRSSQFIYTAADGSPVQFGRGASYVNIIPTKNDITVE